MMGGCTFAVSQRSAPLCGRIAQTRAMVNTAAKLRVSNSMAFCDTSEQLITLDRGNSATSISFGARPPS